MSRTLAHNPNRSYLKKNKNANPLGICHCSQCRYGRMRRKSRDGDIDTMKKRLRRWWGNKPPKKGIYTD